MDSNTEVSIEPLINSASQLISGIQPTESASTIPDENTGVDVHPLLDSVNDAISTLTVNPTTPNNVSQDISTNVINDLIKLYTEIFRFDLSGTSIPTPTPTVNPPVNPVNPPVNPVNPPPKPVNPPINPSTPIVVDSSENVYTIIYPYDADIEYTKLNSAGAIIILNGRAYSDISKNSVNMSTIEYLCDEKREDSGETRSMKRTDKTYWLKLTVDYQHKIQTIEGRNDEGKYEENTNIDARVVDNNGNSVVDTGHYQALVDIIRTSNLFYEQ